MIQTCVKYSLFVAILGPRRFGLWTKLILTLSINRNLEESRFHFTVYWNVKSVFIYETEIYDAYVHTLNCLLFPMLAGNGPYTTGVCVIDMILLQSFSNMVSHWLVLHGCQSCISQWSYFRFAPSYRYVFRVGALALARPCLICLCSHNCGVTALYFRLIDRMCLACKITDRPRGRA